MGGLEHASKAYIGMRKTETLINAINHLEGLHCFPGKQKLFCD
jgi:hypothetical protein